MSTRIVRKAVLAVGVALAGAPVWAGLAMAADAPVSASIGAGKDNQTVGTATITRTVAGNGQETLTVHMSVPGGISESSVCISDKQFTSRIPPGSCPYHLGKTGTSADYTINLGTAYVGKTVYVQAHVDTGGQTAFAGWVDGSPFYGNLAVAASGGTSVPVGALGGIGLTLVAGLALAVAVGVARGRFRRRSSTASA